MRLFLHGQSPTSTLLAQLNKNQDSRISSLYLSSWTLVRPEDDSEVSLLMALSAFLQRNLGMTEVILQNCSGDNLTELVSLIVYSSPYTLTIRYDLQQYMPSSIALALAQGTQSRIRGLTLQGITLDPALLESLQLSPLRSIETLTIKGNILLSDADKGVSILGERFDSESYFEIEDSLNQFTSLLLELPNLKCLQLEGCHLDDEQLTLLINTALLSSDVRTLNLRGNKCQEATMNTLSKHLSSSESTLETLDLTWQLLPCEAASMPLSRPTMNPQPKLRATKPMDGIPLLATALRANGSLKNLILSENKIHQADFEILVEALQTNETMEYLELKDCHLKSNALRCLGNALPKLQLKSLHINGYQKLSPSYEEKKLRSMFLVPLAFNHHMKDLEMNCRSQSIDWLLDWNRSGRPEILDQSQIPSSLAPTIVGMQGNVLIASEG